MPGAQVPLVIQSTPMALTVSGDTDAHGDTIGHILVSMPMATFLVAMDEEGGHALIRDLEKIFGRPPGTIAVVSEMPDGPNGRGPRP